MAKIPFLRRPCLFLFLLLLLPTATAPSPLQNYRTLLSLAHSLTVRVSNHRLSHGDTLGAARARSIANHIEAAASLGGWGFWTNAWRFGWDYARNYAWRSDWETYREVYGAVGELNDLTSLLGDYARVRSERERVAWFGRNYKNVVGSVKAVFGRLLGVFARSAALREAVETMRKEVVDGDFLRDCIEIGGDDLKGIIQVVKDLLLRLYAPSEPSQEL